MGNTIEVRDPAAPGLRCYTRIKTSAVRFSWL
jgi:hypothetical protein